MYANFHSYSCYYGLISIHYRHRLFVSCSVSVVLLVMCCMCIPAFIVTYDDISQLWVYLLILPEALLFYKLVMFMERG